MDLFLQLVTVAEKTKAIAYHAGFELTEFRMTRKQYNNVRLSPLFLTQTVLTANPDDHGSICGLKIVIDDRCNDGQT